MRADSVEWSWLDDWKNVSITKFQSGRLVPEKGPSNGKMEGIEEKEYLQNTHLNSSNESQISRRVFQEI